MSERNGLTVINSTCPNIKELSLAEREEEQADEEEEQGDDDGEHDSRSPQGDRNLSFPEQKIKGFQCSHPSLPWGLLLQFLSG